MGRGRQKAKQTKVARKLKYETHEPDLAALQRELSGANKAPNHPYDDEDDDYYEIPPAIDDWQPR